MSIISWFRGKFGKNSLKKQVEQNIKPHSLKLGLALGGGGTRGAAYIGMFKAFEEAGLHFDYVAGTSAGALFGSAYCAGLSSNDMLNIATNLKAKDIRTNKISFMPSKTDKFSAFIDEILRHKTFEDMSIPFTAVVVDLITGDELHMNTGDIGKCVAGSCAFPGAFVPVEYPPYRLIDGSLRNNIPADVVRDMGADIVLAVDLNPARGLGTSSTKYLDLMKTSLGIVMKANSLGGYVYSDYVLKFDLSEFSQTKLDNVQGMVDLAYNITKEEMPNILKVLGMHIPNEDIKETIKRVKLMQKRAKRIAKENMKKEKENKTLAE